MYKLLFLLLIFPIRGYLPLILPVVLIFCYKNDKKIITIKDILYFLIIILYRVFHLHEKFNTCQNNYIISKNNDIVNN